MKISNTIIIFTSIGLFTLIFVGVPFWIHTENGNQSVQNEDLIIINGSIENIRKTTTGGKHSKPIIYLKLIKYPFEFRISNSSYKAIDKGLVDKILQKGTNVIIETKNNEIIRSQSGSILNAVFKWRGKPLIYSLKAENESLLTVKQYNNQKERFNANNIKWGIILVLFIAGQLFCMDYQEKKVKVKE